MSLSVALAPVDAKECIGCAKALPLDAFAFKKSRNTYMARCRTCVRTAYVKWRQKRMADAVANPPAVVKCSRCKALKPSADFTKSKHSHTGRYSQCRSCASASKREAWASGGSERYKIAQKRVPQEKRTIRLAQRSARALEKAYGITLEDYQSLLHQQGGVCAICREATRSNALHRRLSVDHCHETGMVRGLLCSSCNNGLGRFADDPDRLASAAAYLRAHRMRGPKC